MELSNRLETIARYVGQNEIVADIGTDHGYIPIYLAKKGIVSKVYAADINKGPLEKAKKNILLFGVKDNVIPIQSNGLKGFRDISLDTVIIAGMGGMLIHNILREGKNALKNVKKLILSPHLDSDIVRKAVHQLDFKIADEKLLEEEQKRYNVIICKKGKEKYEKEIYYQYGKILIEEKNPVLYKLLNEKLDEKNKIMKNIENIYTKNTKERILTIKKDISEINEVLKWFM